MGGSYGSFKQEKEREREGGRRGEKAGGRSTVRNLWFISNRSPGTLEDARTNSARLDDSKLFDS